MHYADISKEFSLSICKQINGSFVIMVFLFILFIEQTSACIRLISLKLLNIFISYSEHHRLDEFSSFIIQEGERLLKTNLGRCMRQRVIYP